jgi:KipI family sensor histidine kinase inhibitor
MLAATGRLREGFGAALVDLVPSYTTLMVHYDLTALSPAQARELIDVALADLQPQAQGSGQSHVLPVWYDLSVGPELTLLSQRSGLTVDDVIRRHSAHDYQVFALGFAPGFAFMGLVDERLATPRLDTPRKRIAAGSVGIAERQTAAYPVVSPGGWNLIGRTPAKLFDRERDGYSLMQPGDTVRFEPVDHAEFINLGGDDTPLEAQA